MTTRGDWRRVSKRQPCPVCGKPDWCAVSTDGTAALCQRVESSRRIGEAGWLHRLQDNSGQPRRRRVRKVRVSSTDVPGADLTHLAARYGAAVNPEHLQQLALALGLSVESLNALGIGWSSQHQAWSFPMTDAAGRVLGIRLRGGDGRKFAVKGSREGLFIPSRGRWVAMGGDPGDTPLMICEGPTDVAALLDLGFPNVAGRPSCTGGTRLLVELIRRRGRPEVVVVADQDEPGQRGADALGSVLVAYSPAVRVMTPPEGIKDMRAWLQASGSRQHVEQVMDAARVRRLRIQAATPLAAVR